MSHTPGPWRVEKTPFEPSPVIVGLMEEGPRPGDFLPNNPRCRVIAQCKGTDDEGKANAYLIASAPDLLEACKLSFAALHHDMEEGGAFQNEQLVKMLRATIDKAEGRKK